MYGRLCFTSASCCQQKKCCFCYHVDKGAQAWGVIWISCYSILIPDVILKLIGEAGYIPGFPVTDSDFYATARQVTLLSQLAIYVFFWLSSSTLLWATCRRQMRHVLPFVMATIFILCIHVWLITIYIMVSYDLSTSRVKLRPNATQVEPTQANSYQRFQRQVSLQTSAPTEVTQNLKTTIPADTNDTTIFIPVDEPRTSPAPAGRIMTYTPIIGAAMSLCLFILHIYSLVCVISYYNILFDRQQKIEPLKLAGESSDVKILVARPSAAIVEGETTMSTNALPPREQYLRDAVSEETTTITKITNTEQARSSYT